MEESERHYKIRWAGKDPDGNDWIDTWIPKYLAHAGARRDWQKRKGEGRKGEFDDS